MGGTNEITTLFGLPLLFVVVVVFLLLWWKKYNNGTMGEKTYRRGHSVLEHYSRNLTRLAREGKLEPVIGRRKEIQKVIQILSRKTKNNPVLVGNAGVGKTAIAEGFAEAIIAKQVPPILQNKDVLALDLTSIIAGTKFRGEFEKRMMAIKDEIVNSNRKIILFIDEIHTLAEAGDATGALDADDILKPALARGELQVIGATTNKEYEETIAKDITLARRLQLIQVPEPSAQETLEILAGIKPKYEEFHGVSIQPQSLKAAVEISQKKMRNRSFPDKAIDLIDEACAKVQLESLQKLTNTKNRPVVKPEHVRAIANEL